MRTNVRIDSATRERLARIAERDYGGASPDETVARPAFEHASFAALARLSDEEPREYRAEQHALAETDVTVSDVHDSE
ncbi:hypothetical protein SAMN04487820_11512 [Actinopolyspora mzabensis]|uniref:Uncharacterized protein n=1 Tax=Actinopolyspora mzabensis TaxID=995066 RepID=A0A1G9FGA4_ACTMZ|nr:hypothetical protein [Actinopolyspora mzabensis]SDK87367.1 hypothetical protein SAMN04487820_11512 [Actinopolyspora mzabensis]